MIFWGVLIFINACEGGKGCEECQGCEAPVFLGCNTCSNKDWSVQVVCPPGNEPKFVCIPCGQACAAERAIEIAQRQNHGCVAGPASGGTGCNCINKEN